MSFETILYKILIGPLELFFEVLYTIAYRFIGNYGLSIIVLSIMMNFLVLLLYKRADEMQEEEKNIEAKLHKGISHIKKTFKGDEKMMMLQTYYRQNNYKPTDIIKGSVSLFLEIPFFIAAYHFLSGLEALKGVDFGPIADLGAQDALLSIGSYHFNILPIIMTGTNLISCVIFTKGYPAKTKVQLYGMAIFFLVFLYSSPSGLVFYWTLNNIFSLIKTIFYKLKNPKKVLSIMASIAGFAFMALGILHIEDTLKKNIFLLCVGVLLQLPVVFMIFKNKIHVPARSEKPNAILFFTGAFFATMFIGVLIPSTFIKASPLEFVDLTYVVNPIWYVVSAGCLAGGLFLVWMRVFYWLMNDAGKVLFERLLWIFNILSAVNYMFFGKDLGIISSALVYENGLNFTREQQLFNLIILLMVAIMFFVIICYFEDKIKGILFAAVFAVVGMSIFNIHAIQTAVSESINAEKDNTETPHWSLSKNAKNVIVLMLDRAMGEYIPYIMNEKPELKEQFSGFTYYSNVSSFGAATNFGSPALYGGYEYTPDEINKRDTESLKDKQNEALKVMPVLFDENGYDVTVCDPTYANYQWIPDLSIYNDYPNIKTYITNGEFSDTEIKTAKVRGNMRNFFCFGIMKVAPLVIQKTIYDNGKYNESQKGNQEFDYSGQVIRNLSIANGVNALFMNAYTVLQSFPHITSVNENNKGTFLLLSNDTTHEPMLLQEPSYTPQQNVDNSEYDNTHSNRFHLDGKTLKMENETHVIHYQTNMAALIELGKWFDWLKEKGVYDNTRIIIVADHGRNVNQLDELGIDKDEWNQFFDKEFYFPLLMVKDYDAKEYSVSDEYMTNADVPTLAMQGIIDKPINPFTGKEINNSEKTAHDQYILASNDWDITENNGNTFLPGMWLSVHDNIWDKSNWKVLQENSISPFEEKTE